MAAGARRRSADVVASPSKTCNNALVVMRPARREPLPWPLALLRFLPREQTIVCKARLTRCASFTRCARPSGQPAAVTALRFVYSLRSPFGPACGCYFASLRLLAALALRASLRLLLRFATFARNQGRGSDDANRPGWSTGPGNKINQVQSRE